MKLNDDILEQYLADTVDLRNAPAIITEPDKGDGTWPIYRTLDGTQIYSLWDLAEMTGRDIRELRKLFQAGKIKGIQMGGDWFARKEAVEESSMAEGVNKGKKQ